MKLWKGQWEPGQVELSLLGHERYSHTGISDSLLRLFLENDFGGNNTGGRETY